MDEAVELTKELGREVSDKYEIPVFLYEESATKEERRNLATIRHGVYEGLDEKLNNHEWKPDFGDNKNILQQVR